MNYYLFGSIIILAIFIIFFVVPSSYTNYIKQVPIVSNIDKNYYTYQMANDLCQEYGTRLATDDELLEAWKHGQRWDNLSWINGGRAYKLSSSGPQGGQMPSELKLGIACYDPMKLVPSTDKLPKPDNTQMVPVEQSDNIQRVPQSDDTSKINPVCKRILSL